MTARDLLLSVPVVAARPLGGHVQQAAPATPTPLAHDTGAASTGCICGHSRTFHRRYRECVADGCACWTYRKTTNKTTAAPVAPGRRS